MRSLILVLILACLFGAAALWQQTRTARLREERALALQIAAGETAMTPSGLLGPGEAVVVVGRPSGVPPAARTAPPTPPPNAPPSPTPQPAPQPGTTQPPVNPAPPVAPAPPVSPAPLGDFVLEVTPGQSLSKIAAAHYGRSQADLVTKLAQYNGLADANALRVGMQLKLPALERLGVVLKPR